MSFCHISIPYINVGFSIECLLILYKLFMCISMNGIVLGNKQYNDSPRPPIIANFILCKINNIIYFNFCDGLVFFKINLQLYIVSPYVNQELDKQQLHQSAVRRFFLSEQTTKLLLREIKNHERLQKKKM